MKIEEIVKELISSNKELLNEEELNISKENIELTKKIFLMGLITGKEIYGKNLQ